MSADMSMKDQDAGETMQTPQTDYQNHEDNAMCTTDDVMQTGDKRDDMQSDAAKEEMRATEPVSQNSHGIDLLSRCVENRASQLRNGEQIIDRQSYVPLRERHQRQVDALRDVRESKIREARVALMVKYGRVFGESNKDFELALMNSLARGGYTIGIDVGVPGPPFVGKACSCAKELLVGVSDALAHVAKDSIGLAVCSLCNETTIALRILRQTRAFKSFNTQAFHHAVLHTFELQVEDLDDTGRMLVFHMNRAVTLEALLRQFM